MSKRNPICSECGQLAGHHTNCPEGGAHVPYDEDENTTDQINTHLTDIIADVEKVRKAVNDDEREPKIDGDAILSKLADVSNALDDLYNEITGI